MHVDPEVIVVHHGQLSQNDSHKPAQQKRPNDTPLSTEQNKRYALDNNYLLTQNKYYLPPQLTPNDNQEKSNDVTAITTPVKIPPIFIHDASNYQQVINDIKSKVKNEFTTNNKGSQIKINLNSIEDYRALTAYYDSEGNIKYHTYQNPDTANVSVIIRNLPTSITDQEIKDELLLKDFPVTNVTRLRNKEKQPIPLCAVILAKGEKSKSIFHLETLYHCRITVEPRRGGRGIPQCTRCQRYTHTRNYCKLPPRCVKCLGDHHFSECTKQREEKPRCVNCEGEHTANYKGCPHYQQLINNKNLSQSNSRNTVRRPPTTDRYTSPNTSFAKLLHNRNNTPEYDSKNENNKSKSNTSTSIVETILQTIFQAIMPHLNQIKNFIMSLIPTLFQNGFQP